MPSRTIATSPTMAVMRSDSGLRVVVTRYGPGCGLVDVVL